MLTARCQMCIFFSHRLESRAWVSAAWVPGWIAHTAGSRADSLEGVLNVGADSTTKRNYGQSMYWA